MDRRSFLQNTTLVAGGTLVAPSVIARNSTEIEIPKNQCLTILHTNDTHSNIDPFPVNHAKYPGKGGVSRRFEIIERIRGEEENVLLLDAGDIFQGTPYFNMFEGVLEMKVMSKLGYDVATMGNHDFDAGLEGFMKANAYADFPFVCSNYDFTNTPIEGATKSNVVIRKGDYKIGIFGVGVELDGLVPKNKYSETVYNDPVEIASDMVANLQKEECDLIICLSHLGYSYQDPNRMSDINLARKTKGIHLIIGGHTHTFLDKPVAETNSEGKTVLINQVGWGGINLGRIDFHFAESKFRDEKVLLIE